MMATGKSSEGLLALARYVLGYSLLYYLSLMAPVGPNEKIPLRDMESATFKEKFIWIPAVCLR